MSDGDDRELNEVLESIMADGYSSHTVTEKEIAELPIKWFDIDINFIKNHEKSIIGFMAFAVSFNILQNLNFIGHYLPLNNSTNVNQFQLIFNYFSSFKNGIHGTNMQRIIRDFNLIRNKTLNLWDIITNKDEIIPRHILEKSTSLSSMDKLRMTARLKGISSKSKVSSVATNEHQHFWDKNWLLHKSRSKPLEFHGIDKKEKEYYIKTILMWVLGLMDRFNELIIGSDNGLYSYPNKIKGLINIRKVLSVHTNNFFGKVGYNEININPHPSMILKALQGFKEKKVKILFANGQIFIFNSLCFGTLSKQRRDIKENINALTGSRWMTKEKQFKYRISFSSEILSVKDYYGMDAYFKYLFENHDERQIYSLSYSDLTAGGGNLLLLNIILNFAIFNGSCGIEYDEANEKYMQSIVCIWDPPTDSIQQFANASNKLVMHRHYVRRDNITNEWTVADKLVSNSDEHNRTVPNSEESHWEHDSEFSDNDIYVISSISRKRNHGHGLTEKMLTEHNLRSSERKFNI